MTYLFVSKLQVISRADQCVLVSFCVLFALNDSAIIFRPVVEIFIPR